MEMRDLVLERLNLLRRTGPRMDMSEIEEFLSEPFTPSRYSRWLPEMQVVMAETHNYLQGAADALDVTVLSLLDDLDIDIEAFAQKPSSSRRR